MAVKLPKIRKGSAEVVELREFKFCEECGSDNVQLFEYGEFVLVKPKSGRPYYGRVIGMERSSEEGFMVKIDRGKNDNELVHYKSVSLV